MPLITTPRAKISLAGCAVWPKSSTGCAGGSVALLCYTIKRPLGRDEMRPVLLACRAFLAWNPEALHGFLDSPASHHSGRSGRADRVSADIQHRPPDRR